MQAGYIVLRVTRFSMKDYELWSNENISSIELTNLTVDDRDIK